MSATPLNISITPDLSVIKWFGRNQDPTEFTITNNDDRDILRCQLHCVRGDFLPKGAGKMEKVFLKKGIGEDLITQGWLEINHDGTWQKLLDSPAELGGIPKTTSIQFSLRLVVPDEITNEGKTNFALMVAVTDKVAAPITLLYTDFESYAINSYPSNIFTIQYNGSAASNQKIMLSTDIDGNPTQVFRLHGRSGWASESLFPLATYANPLPEIITMDAMIRPISGTYCGGIGLRNPAGTWGTRVSDVILMSNNIQIADWTTGAKVMSTVASFTWNTWVRITMQHNLTLKTYNLYINDVLISTKKMHARLPPTQYSIFAGNSGNYCELYFDNVGLYAGTALPPGV